MTCPPDWGATSPPWSPPRRTLAGLAVVCFANLLLSVLLARIFSATMFYHFTFLAVALAMFGVAASGVYVFQHEERLAKAPERALGGPAPGSARPRSPSSTPWPTPSTSSSTTAPAGSRTSRPASSGSSSCWWR
ncbi:MAG: hypothetical protein HS111_32335 [Kofleriaceae bacterium]|nr:hypothetical protein [Kofleriaceae bacterium]